MIVSGEDDEDDVQDDFPQQPSTLPLPTTAQSSQAFPPAPLSSSSASSVRASPPAINTSFASSLLSFPAPTSSSPRGAAPFPSSLLPPSHPSSARVPSASVRRLRALSSSLSASVHRLSAAQLTALYSAVQSQHAGLVASMALAQDMTGKIRVGGEGMKRLLEDMRRVSDALGRLKDEDDDHERDHAAHALP